MPNLVWTKGTVSLCYDIPPISRRGLSYLSYHTRTIDSVYLTDYASGKTFGAA